MFGLITFLTTICRSMTGQDKIIQKRTEYERTGKNNDGIGPNRMQ